MKITCPNCGQQLSIAKPRGDKAVLPQHRSGWIKTWTVIDGTEKRSIDIRMACGYSGAEILFV